MIPLRHKLTRGSFTLDVDVEIPATGITGVFGESGSGKTSLLRCIAGLEGESAGNVHRRRIAYVHQEPQLFAHLSVRGNIEYGKRRNPDAGVEVDAIAAQFEVDHLLDRSVSDL